MKEQINGEMTKREHISLLTKPKNSATIPICGKEQNMGARKIMVAD